MTLHPSIRTFLSSEHLSLGAAQEFVRIVNSAIEARGVCSVALSGGETPRRMYNRLAKATFANSVDWNKVHVFFGDERVVPPTDHQSNFGMVDHELLSHLDIPDRNVHRILGEISPEDAARRYEQVLEDVFGYQEVRFDLVLLGLGEDGHTASLFPGTRALNEEQHSVSPNFVPQLESWRISLTFPIINKARWIVFLVAGTSKAAILRRVIGANGPSKDLPATMVLPKEGILLWMIDTDAWSQIKDLPGLSAAKQED